MNDQTVYDRWNQLSQRVIETSYRLPPLETQAARVLDALQAGEKIYCRKSFKWEGKEVKPGDVFIYDPANTARAQKLAAHAFLIPEKEYLIGRRNNEARKAIETLQPLKFSLDFRRSERERAAVGMAAAQAQLQAADTRLRDALAAEQAAEKNLSEALDGEPVRDLLAIG